MLTSFHLSLTVWCCYTGGLFLEKFASGWEFASPTHRPAAATSTSSRGIHSAQIQAARTSTAANRSRVARFIAASLPGPPATGPGSHRGSKSDSQPAPPGSPAGALSYIRRLRTGRAQRRPPGRCTRFFHSALPSLFVDRSGVYSILINQMPDTICISDNG